MISTTYQPAVAVVLLLTGVVIGVVYAIYDLLVSHLRRKWLRTLTDSIIVVVVYIVLALVVYHYDSGRVRLYTAICVSVGVLIGGLIYRCVVYIAKLVKKSLTKHTQLSHNSRGE